MRHRKVKLSTILFLGIGLTGLHAQEAIPATGGNASGSGGSASYSVGQVVYQTNTGTNGSVAEGVQQPYEISVVTALDETEGITLQYSAYPNPANDLVTLNINTSLGIQNMAYQLYDFSGKLLEESKITGNETDVLMKNLVSSTYFLKIIENNKEVKIFKIVKK